MSSQYIGRKNIVLAFDKYTDKQGQEKTKL